MGSKILLGLKLFVTQIIFGIVVTTVYFSGVLLIMLFNLSSYKDIVGSQIYSLGSGFALVIFVIIFILALLFNFWLSGLIANKLWRWK